MQLTPTVLSEAEATPQATLVDPRGALTIRNGRLVRPLSHSGLGRGRVLTCRRTGRLSSYGLLKYRPKQRPRWSVLRSKTS